MMIPPLAALKTSSPQFLAGVGEQDITPPLGVAMTGYAGRPGPADRVLDRLAVRALALCGPEGEPLVLTGADLLGISPSMVEAIRRELWPLFPPERLLLNHSHTHAAPAAARLRGLGEPDPAYCRRVVAATAEAARQALAGLRPAHVAFGAAPTAIGVNRRASKDGQVRMGINPDGPNDPTVYVLRVEDASRRPLACWFSHAAHPIILDHRNTGLSAEWPGIAAAALAEALGCPAVFAQGCGGDINPVRRGDYAVVRSVGEELAGAALAAWERAEPVGSVRTADAVAGAITTVRLPQRRPTPEEAEIGQRAAETAAVEIGWGQGAIPAEEVHLHEQVARAMLEWSHAYSLAAREEGTASVPMDVQALRIGDVIIAATGAETFIEIGKQIQLRSPFRHTVALGYSNGCLGYLPTAAEFARGGYEVEKAYKYYGTLPLTPACEGLTLEAAEWVIRQTLPRENAGKSVHLPRSPFPPAARREDTARDDCPSSPVL
jgi:hypothetical protein